MPAMLQTCCRHVDGFPAFDYRHRGTAELSVTSASVSASAAHRIAFYFLVFPRTTHVFRMMFRGVHVFFAIFLSFLLRQASSSSWLATPASRSTQSTTLQANFDGPCDSPFSPNSSRILVQRGQSISLLWPRNNHAGRLPAGPRSRFLRD